MADELFTSVREAARRLAVSRTTLYELISQGEVRIVKFRSRTLVPVAELERFATKLIESDAEPGGGAP
jgi:excisionase family DNA binding protein